MCCHHSFALISVISAVNICCDNVCYRSVCAYCACMYAYVIFYEQHWIHCALTLLVGRQEGHPAGKKTGCWFVGGDDLTGALHVL